MIQREFEDESLTERCNAAVAQVLKRYDWRLLEANEFVRRTEDNIRTSAIENPWVAAVNVYCQCLYTTCRGDEGPVRQERAFLELQHYLFEISFREVADIPTDLRWEHVNEALLRIWQRLPAYYKPGAFLALAAMELRNVMRPWWSRQHGRERQAWELPPTSIDRAMEQPDAGESPDGRAISKELVQQVRHCFNEMLRRYPRARQQLEAVWLKYIDGLDDESISQYLEKPITGVHVLRSRGLRRLRAEPSWQLLARDLGL
jgi:DNA-directed RNA polymerase specialized sigma24 family protein